jgi:hypothetical protein
MGLRPTRGNENPHPCRPRESGGPSRWIPACAGMTQLSTEFPWACGPPEGMKIRTPVAPAKAGAHVSGFPLARE